MAADTPGQRIKSRRDEIPRYWRNQQALADDVGVTRTTVSAWENDRFRPEGENLRRLSECLDRPMGWIVGQFPTAAGDAMPAGDSARLALTLIQMDENPEVWSHAMAEAGDPWRFLVDSAQRLREIKPRVWTEDDERLWSAYVRGRRAAAAVSGDRLPTAEGMIEGAKAAAEHRGRMPGEDRDRREGSARARAGTRVPWRSRRCTPQRSRRAARRVAARRRGSPRRRASPE